MLIFFCLKKKEAKYGLINLPGRWNCYNVFIFIFIIFCIIFTQDLKILKMIIINLNYYKQNMIIYNIIIIY